MKKHFIKLALIMLTLLFSTNPISAQKINENGELLDWANAPSHLVMPESVIKIADNCFCEHYQEGWDEYYYPNSDITTIDFVNTEIIGKQAFYQLPNLTEIVAALHVKEIMSEAFAECNSLKSISLPAIETLREKALADCWTLQSIHLGKNLKTVEPKAFKNCPKLSSLTMEEGGEFFFVKDNVLISKEGMIMGSAMTIDEINIDEAKSISEYAFQNNTNIKKIVLNNVTEIADGAFCGTSSLEDLRLPKLTKLPGWAPMLFSGCSSLRIFDIHESNDFEGFGNCNIPDNTGMKIYVANETVKSRIEGNFKCAEVVVGAPKDEIKKFNVTYTFNENGGNMDVWDKSAQYVASGSMIAEHSKISFKAIPLMDYKIGSFTVNGIDVMDELDFNYGPGIYVVEDVVSDLNINVTFVKDEGDIIFFSAFPSNAGTVKCHLENGEYINNCDKVPSNTKLYFEASTDLAGFHIESWTKELGDEYVTIQGQDGKSTYECVSESGLDIRVIFAINSNHHLFQFKNQNSETGSLNCFIENKEIQPIGAYPDGSIITMKATPSEGADINCIKWFEITTDDFVEIKEYKNKNEITFPLDHSRYISMLCTHEEVPNPGENDPVIVDGHLIKWAALDTVTLPDEVEYIDKQAFRGAMDLKKITLNSKVKYIGEAAFLMCPELTEIIVPENNPYFKSINGVVYSKDGKVLIVYPGGKKDKCAVIPAHVEEIVPGALLTTPNIKEVAVEEGNAYYEVLSNSLVRKSDKTMVYYPNAGFMNEDEPKLSLDPGIESIGRLALAYIPALTVLELHENVKKFEPCACLAAGGLREIKPYEGFNLKDIKLEEIGDSAFFYNMSIERLPYMKNLKRIGVESFARNYNLVEVHIPADCEINHKAFDTAMALVYVLCYGSTPSVIDNETFTNMSNMDELLLAVPTGSLEAYQNAEGWKDFPNMMEFDPEATTGIKVIDSDINDNAYYTLEGIRVKTPIKNSLYIHNGKKIIF